MSNEEHGKVEEAEEEEVGKAEPKDFRGAAALLNYYGQDNPDCEYSAEEASSWALLSRNSVVMMMSSAVVRDDSETIASAFRRLCRDSRSRWIPGTCVRGNQRATT